MIKLKNLFENIDFLWEYDEKKIYKKELKHSTIKSNVEIISDILNKFNGEDVYITFRDSVRETMINPNNKYGTPTGVYCYPLGIIFKATLGINNWSDLKNLESDKIFSSSVFPYQNRLEFMGIFHVNKNDNVLYTSKKQDEKVISYIEKIKNIYSDDEDVQYECNHYIKNGNFYSDYSNKQVSGVEGLWLFIYHIGKIRKERNITTFFTLLSHKIGLDGVVDDKGISLIHPNEPIQAVFFKVKTITDFFTVLSQSKGSSFQIPKDKPLLFHQLPPKKNKSSVLINILRKKYPGYSIDKVDFFDYESIFDNPITFPIEFDNDMKFFNFNRYTSEFTEIPLDKIDITQYDGWIINEYFRMKYGRELIRSSYSKYHNGVFILIFKQDNKDVPFFVDKELNKNLGKYTLNEVSGLNGHYIAAYFNTKFNTFYTNVSNFNDYISDAPQNIFYINDEKPHIIDENNKVITNESLLKSLIKNDDQLSSKIIAAIVNTLKFDLKYSDIYKKNGYYIGIQNQVQIYLDENFEEIDVDKINPKTINNPEFLEFYFNKKYNQKFKFYTTFEKLNNAFITNQQNNENYFIDMNGKPSTDGINDVFDITNKTSLNYDASSVMYATFINQKYDKDYFMVYPTSYEDKLLGYLKPYNDMSDIVLINKFGEVNPLTWDEFNGNLPYTDNLIYFNSLFDNPQFNSVKEILNTNLYLAKTKKNQFPIIINKNGEKTTDDLTFNDSLTIKQDIMFNNEFPAAYLNTKLDKLRYFSRTMSIDLYDNLNKPFYVFQTYDPNTPTVFVNHKGIETIENISYENLNVDNTYYSEILRITYNILKKEKKLMNEIKRSIQIMKII